ncbi:MAG: hypothetical protein LC797_22935 [Chloroflexi bacterium]|nr:hypothetical protein [Chloroflexota bacterium]
MKFKAGGLEFNATVADAGEAPSPQTGDPLRTLIIQFRAQKAAMHEQALNEAQQRQSGGLFSLGEADQPDQEWRVRESTSSYVGSEPWGINHHTWRIEQVERLACERLIVGSVELEPYEYAEAVSDAGMVRLAARARASRAQLAELALVGDVASVIRVGISDAPRPMTVTYLWGQTRDGQAGVAVRCQDAGEPRLSLDGASFALDMLGELIGVLQTKGVLDEADLEVLRRRRHAVRRVATIDGWPLAE